jgi:hypothetical protein
MKKNNVIKTFDSMILDKNLDIDKRKAMYLMMSDIDPIQTFGVTLELYRTLDTKNVFNGYNKRIHKKENTEFLLFRKFLRDRIYKYYLHDQKDCTSKLRDLLSEKDFDTTVKKEVEDLYSGLTSPENILCFDMTTERKKGLDEYCCRNGITFDELLEEICEKNKAEINRIIKSITEER